MLDQLFEASKAPRRLPVRERGHLANDMLRYTDADGRHDIFVTSGAQAQLREGTSRNAPNEAFGLLMGRGYSDADGDYTVVSAVCYAPPALRDASRGHVQVNERQMSELRVLAERQFPAHDIVGWTHSHHRPSGYSSTDFAEQRSWTEPYNVGLVTFMDDGALPYAYCGPDGIKLTPLLPRAQRANQAAIDPATLFAPAGHSDVSAPTGHWTTVPRITTIADQPAGEKQMTTPLPVPVAPARSASPSAVLPWFAALVAVVVVGFALLALQVHQVGQHVSAISERAVAPPSAAVDWNCTPGDTSVSCVASAGDPTTTRWLWDFGDGAMGAGQTVSHAYAQDGIYTVRLIVVTDGDAIVDSRAVLVGTPAALPGRDAPE